MLALAAVLALTSQGWHGGETPLLLASAAAGPRSWGSSSGDRGSREDATEEVASWSA